MYWKKTAELASQKYTCGYCGALIASRTGYYATDISWDEGKAAEYWFVYICHHCDQPTFFRSNGRQVPAPTFGRAVEHLPDHIGALYDEARRCLQVNAFTGLGLSTEGIVGREFEHGAVAFFDLQSGLKLAIWHRNDLALDARVATSAPSPTEFGLGHNVANKQEVDAVMEQAGRAGAKIVKPAEDTFWDGYAGYFQDTDGHLWEIAWNPQMEIIDASE